MSRVSDREWQLLRRFFGDLAYEYPELHKEWLKIIQIRLVVDNTQKE